MLPLCPLDVGSTQSRPRLELCQHASHPPLVGLYIIIYLKKSTMQNEPSRCGLFSGWGSFFPFFLFFIFLFFYYFYFIFFIFYFSFFIFFSFSFSIFYFFIFSFFIFFDDVITHPFPLSFLLSPTHPSPLSFLPSSPLPSLFFSSCLADHSRTLAHTFRGFSEDPLHQSQTSFM